MASKRSATSLQTLVQRSRERCTCATISTKSSTRRSLSTTTRRLEDARSEHLGTTETNERPRWSYTPPAMKAPFSPNIKDPTKKWEVNEDPAKVDAMYRKMFGPGGENVLSDEIRWLAITHKSFDQGRRGFNDRLAFYGKRLLILQANIALLAAPVPNTPSTITESSPALRGLANISATAIDDIFSRDRMSQLAQSYGIDQVTRWKPRAIHNLKMSGCDVVYATSLYAIIGAVALQRGGKMANEVARELVLRPLGL